jgi:septal ring factor EnvC (AmiA/AmiB activator)
MKKLTIWLLLQFIVVFVNAQPPEDKDALLKERDSYKKELSDLERQLRQIQGNKQKSLADLRFIQDKMSVRQKLVDNIGRELSYIDRDMGKTQREINLLNAKLDTLKKAYAKSIVYAYKNRNNYDFLTFIFSSNSFNEAVKRIQYLKSYRNYRARQAEDIRKYKNFLLGKTKELDTKKKEKSSVMGNQNIELNQLAGDRSDLDNTVKEITSKEKNIGGLIAKIKKRQNRITAQIVAINKKEEMVRKKAMDAERKRLKDLADARAREDAIKNKTKTIPVKPGVKPVVKTVTPPKPKVDEPLYTPEEVNANAGFEQNRGRFPYPLQGSYISTRFGVQDLGGVKFNNEGTTFETAAPGSGVIAIFNGTVSSIYDDEGTKQVFITHGRYKSVYANLSSASVSVGQSVTTGQVIGRSASSEEGTGRGVLEFMMFRDNKIENPERWIRK